MFYTLDDMLTADAPTNCEPVQALWNWSMNCEHPTPAGVFADLIGATEEYCGEGITLGGANFARLGYMELDYLADALKAYAEHPDQVRHYVRQLLDAEML